MTNLTELREKAEAATPGPWTSTTLDYGLRYSYQVEGPLSMSEGCVGPIEMWDKTDAGFIAAFNPTVALELLDRLEKAEAERDMLRKHVKNKDKLLICYRTGGRPSSKLLDDLEKINDKLAREALAESGEK